MQMLMKDWAEAFHQEHNRDPDYYFKSLQKVFPNIGYIMDLSLFAHCFNMFADAIEKYQAEAARLAKEEAKAFNSRNWTESHEVKNWH